MNDVDTIKIRFNCTACGEISLDLPDDYNEDSIATCKNCGIQFGRWGDVKSGSLELAKSEVVKMAKDIFKDF